MTRTKSVTYEIEIGEDLYRVDVTITGCYSPEIRYDRDGSGCPADESKDWTIDRVVYINESGEEYENKPFDELEAEVESKVDREIINYYD